MNNDPEDTHDIVTPTSRTRLGDAGSRVDIDDGPYVEWPIGLQFDIARAAVRRLGGFRGPRTFVNLTGPHLDEMIDNHTDMRPQNLLGVKGLSRLQLPSSIQTMVFHADFGDSIRAYDKWPALLKMLSFPSMSTADNVLDHEYVFPPGLERVYFPIDDPRLSLATAAGFAWPDSIVEMSLRVDHEGIRISLRNPNTWPHRLETLRLTVARDNRGNPEGDIEALDDMPATPASSDEANLDTVSAYLTMLPATLRTVHFNARMYNMTTTHWPETVTKLTLAGASAMFHSGSRAWPASLTDLDMGGVERLEPDDEPLANMAPGVEPAQLQVGMGGFWNPDNIVPFRVLLPRSNIAPVGWPATLQHIVLPTFFNDEIPQLPPGLRSMEFGDDYDSPLPDAPLPAMLQRLTFGREYNQEIPDFRFPETLRSLTFGYFFDKPLPDFPLPANLQTLTLGISYSWPVPEIGPDTQVLRINT